MAFMKFYVGNEANASSHRDGIYIAIDTKKIFYNGSAYGGSEVDLSNYYTIAQVNGKIGTNVYTGANYISKETNLTEAVLQLDEEIKATNDNLTLEHENAEATYAKKTELDGYATQEWVNGKGFLTKATADSTYQAKGNYLTSVSWSQISGKPEFATVATSGSYKDLTNKPTIPNVSAVNNSGTISLIIDSNTITFRSDGIDFNGSSIMTVPVVEVLTTEEINNILNS